MTKWYVGPSSAGLNDGTSWANRKGTLNLAEGLALVGGDQVFVGPGVYRETLTLAKSGGSAYSTGTVSVTNGSKIVTGSGTTFTGNSFVDGVFQVSQIAHGTDGVTNGTGTFTSAAGNFQASMIGLTIRITTKIAAIISAVASATSITLTDPAGGAVAPSAGTTLTYDVGPESPYRIVSVDSTTQLTLDQAWSGPTMTGLAYTTWRDIRFTADLTGQNTDGVGGVVRVTGSDNDQTATRSNVWVNNGFNYRTFRGFLFDTATSNLLRLQISSSVGIILEDCSLMWSASQSLLGVASGVFVTLFTVRRCVFYGGYSNATIAWGGTAGDNQSTLFENCLFMGTQAACLGASKAGGILVRASTFFGMNTGSTTATPTTGQAMTFNNCLFVNCTAALSATPAGSIIEDYNSFFNNNTDRSNVTVGQHSKAYSPLFVPLPLLANGRVEPWLPFSLLPASGQRNLAGLFPPATDLYGTPRPQETNADWGAVEAQPQPTMNLNGGTWEAVLAGRGYLDRQMPVKNNVAVTFSVAVRWDSNASIGVKPSLELLADYGVPGQEVFATGTGGTETITLSAVTPSVPLVSGNQPNGRLILRVHNNSTDTVARNVYLTALKGV